MKRNCRLSVVLLVVALVGVTVMMASCRSETDEIAPGADSASQVVAKIGDYTITRGEVQERLAQRIRPQRDDSGLPKPPVTPESVLRTLVAEKAMMLEGRKLRYLDDEMLRNSVDRFRHRELIKLLLTDYVKENIPVTAEEVEQTLEADPNLTSEQAEMKIRGPKATPLVEKFYAELLKKFKVEKAKENFSKAIEIHHRLATRPVVPRPQGMFWVTNKQIRTELSEDEKKIPLARYVGGEFTLVQWFKVLSDMAPPGRPKNLNRPEGIEGLLDRGLRPVILVAEAVARGYDKNEEFLAEIRKREDSTLLGKAKSDKYKNMEQPTDEEIKAFFEAHQAKFAKPASLKIEPIWCKDKETAQAAKGLLTGGATTASVNETHGLRKDLRAYNVYPTSEGLFWDDLWKAEPNAIVGPVKGFYDTGIKWRLVKVIEKTPSVAQPYSDSVKNQVKSALMTGRREAIMARFEAEMLETYPHEIYADKIQDIDPLEVTPSDE